MFRQLTFMALLVLSQSCPATSTSGCAADGWRGFSVIVLGRVDRSPAPRFSGVTDAESFVIEVEKAYKGTAAHCRIAFAYAQPRYPGPVNMTPGVRYLVLLRTLQARQDEHDPPTNCISILRMGTAYPVDDVQFKDVEAGLCTLLAYESVPRDGRKDFLIKNLGNTNKYVRVFLEGEILMAQLQEAIPYYQQRLSQATTESEKLDLIADLRCLGAQDVKETLCAWLADPAFKDKKEVIEEMNKLGDKSLVPAIREHIGATNELLAVAARGTVLQLGDPQGVALLLYMLKRSHDATVRYNAIFPLWHYSGNFSAKEKAAIAALVHDKDPAIARVAGFMVEKWQRKANRDGR